MVILQGFVGVIEFGHFVFGKIEELWIQVFALKGIRMEAFDLVMVGSFNVGQRCRRSYSQQLVMFAKRCT